MPINFPNSPSINQQFTSGGTTWIWDGSEWNLYIGQNVVTSAQLSSTLSSYAQNTSPTIGGTATFVNKPVMPGYQDDIPYVSSAPVSPTPNPGDYYVNSSENMLYVYINAVTGWVSLGSAGDSDQAILAGRMFL